MSTTPHDAQVAIRRQRRLLLVGILLMLTGLVWSLLLQSP